MSGSVSLGTADITVSDTQFLNGLQAGKFHYRTLYKGKSLTDLELYNLLAKALADVRLTDRANAGYIAGFISAMHEQPPQEQRAHVTSAMLKRSEVEQW